MAAAAAVTLVAATARGAWRPLPSGLSWVFADIVIAVPGHRGISSTAFSASSGKWRQQREARSRLSRGAKGFGDEVPKARKGASGFGAPVQPDRSNVLDPSKLAETIAAEAAGAAKAAGGAEAAGADLSPEPVEMPAIMLPGPLKPPAVPASYKALQRIRLRVAPSRFADIMTTVEISEGATFRALEAKTDEENESVMFLRTDKEYGEGWLLDTGVMGKFAGKKVVRRIAGTLGVGKKSAFHEVSEMVNSEVVPADSGETDSGFESQPSPSERREPVLAMLEDPAIVEFCTKTGIDTEKLKTNPEFLHAVARRLYGDEVVS